jgi:hypothetical protein
MILIFDSVYGLVDIWHEIRVKLALSALHYVRFYWFHLMLVDG